MNAADTTQSETRKAVEGEREACAKAVEKVRDGFVAKGPALGVSRTTIEAIRIVTSDLAAAIRARGE